MSLSFEGQPKEADLKERPRLPASSGSAVTFFLPSIYFVVCLLGARIGRESGLNSTVADLIVLISATMATLQLLGRQLPVQNIAGLVVVIGIFSGALLVAANLWNVPLVRPVMNRRFAELPEWTTPLLWVIALVNSRSMAKIVLRGARKSNYGWWLIGLSSLLAAGLNFGAGMSGRTFSLQFAFASLAFIAATPWFLDKRNVPPTLSYQPLLIIISLLFW